MSKFLVSRTIPDSLKEATVTPLLKKSSLDTSNFNNFRPISNLTDLAFQSSHDSQTFCHQSEGRATRD